jgi:intracellular sulfur oxidation DsrE/DsrF family protein
MGKPLMKLSILVVLCLTTSLTYAEQIYKPSKVVYDVSTPVAEELGHILDRASLLQNVYDNNSFEASIIVVIHEGAIPLFAKTSDKHKTLRQRADSLSLGDVIQFRVCAASAKMQGYKSTDFPSFIKVVPMADAEIIMLQQKGYAYLR